jgi:predicted GNAT family acetyltransferase
MLPTIEHLPEQGRFQTTVDGHPGVAEYRLAGGVMLMTHTEVHPALQGRGLAAALVEAALAHARAHGLKVNPLCSYVRAHMRRNPQTQDLLA